MLVDDHQIAELRHAYQVLGVPTDSSALSIKKAYRRLLKRWHPDLYPDGTPTHVEATNMTRLVNEAYAAIANAPLIYHAETYPTQAEERSSQTPSPSENERAWIDDKVRYRLTALFLSLVLVYFLSVKLFDPHRHRYVSVRIACYSLLALWGLPKEWKSLWWWGIFTLGLCLAWYMSLPAR